ncbi:type V toxin-antitoxin system endoribonuclease antitoxin GhoS [Xenorhabdus innexi]|uniref:DUF2622 domain-containing protein n=1 Tax=Xenorhabdus innexi TaxID=290109 RepID=A0A1N6MZB3_9GAMM|nr:type V toxin-antitoxin system endoribonuclease antitoxin GhoS [Xenorhabdus innexi]PHM30031.1 hypothetical protein Xinn_03614 [Xenorhabdus innexi]SIP74161.1 conserved hypothetical protein [Xenorhabdus innexi]
MANYLVRVEIYDAGHNEYEELHKKMRSLGFYKSITFSNGKSHDLPDGTYFGISNNNKSQIMSDVERVSKPLSKKAPAIFICIFTDWTASLYPSK